MTLLTRNLPLALLGGLLVAGSTSANPDALTLGPTAPDGLSATWTGGPYTAANPTNNIQDEPDCNAVPNSCDDMILTLDLPAGYVSANPDHVLLVAVSWTPATANQDVDVYFQNLDGTRAHPPAATFSQPEVAVIPLQDGVRTIRVRLLMYLATNLEFTGTATIGPLPGGIPANADYSLSSDIWSCDTHLIGLSDVPGPPPTVFDHSNDAEPAMRFDADGRAYIGAIAGVPAGSGLWVTQDQCAQTYEFKGAVDAGLGGGDTDVETATSVNLLGEYNVYVSSLTLANITMAMSCDRGETFVLTPISTNSAVVDRQWNAAHGSNIVYLSYHQIATNPPGSILEVVRLTYADCVAQPVILGPTLIYDTTGSQDAFSSRRIGNMATDRREHADNALLMGGPDGEGNVYHAFTQDNATSGRGEVWMGISKDFSLTWNRVRVWEGPIGSTYDHVFSWAAVDGDGNAWVTFSDDLNVYYAVSTDQGSTWSPSVRVNAGVESRTAIFPHVIAGGGGRAVFTFYGHDGFGSADPNANWNVFVSRTDNGLDAFQIPTILPSFSESIASNRTFHQGQVCQGGLGCGCCRQLLECFELDINPTDGRTMVVYGSQSGGSWITNQLTGTSALDGTPLADLSACPDPDDTPPCQALAACLLDPPCQCPGCTVVTDLDADDSPPVPVAAHNIRSVSVAEPHVSSGDPVGGDVMVFSLEMEGLDPQNLPADTIWQVIFGTPTGEFWVRAVNCAATGDTAQYGHFDTTTIVDGPLPHWEFGEGVVCLWIPKSLVGLQTGHVVTGITGHTRQSVGNCGAGPAAFPAVDNTNSAQYLVAGNALPACSPVGVEISEFAAHTVGSAVEVSWTASRVDEFTELRVDRGRTVQGPWKAAHSVKDPRRGEYSFLDRPEAPGRVFYRIVGVQRSGVDVELGVIAVNRLVVHEYSLRLAGPNPFREGTAISYALPLASDVRVDVYNVAGRVVRTLVNRREEAGLYTVAFDGLSEEGRPLGAGVYLVRIHAGDFRKTLRVVSLE